MVPKEVILFLKNIHIFYPIGMPFLLDNYPGTALIQNKIEAKINGIIDGKPSSWSALINSVGQKFSNNAINDRAYIQFPACLLEIELEQKNLEDIIFTRTLILNLSLLCNNYTYFIEDKFIFNVTPATAHRQQFEHKIIFREEHKDAEKLSPYFTMLTEAVEILFPDYLFTPHHLLFNYSVNSGIPWGIFPEMAEQSYPIYNYLFDSQYECKKVEVLK